eukprot:850882-Amphidinium_carterae.1
MALDTKGKGCMDAICEALALLQNTLPDRFGSLPVPSAASWGEWIVVIVNPATSWASVIRTFVKEATSVEFAAHNWDGDTGRVVRSAHTQGGDPCDNVVEHAEPVTAFSCPDCGKSFTTHRAKESHRRCAHGFIPEHARFIRSRQCPSCDAWLKSRHEAVTHIKCSAKCLAWAGENVAPLSDEEYRMVTAAESKVSRHAARTHVPALGPKNTKIGSRPRTRVVVPADIYADTDDEDIPLDILFGLECHDCL